MAFPTNILYRYIDSFEYICSITACKSSLVGSNCVRNAIINDGYIIIATQGYTS